MHRRVKWITARGVIIVMRGRGVVHRYGRWPRFLAWLRSLVGARLWSNLFFR